MSNLANVIGGLLGKTKMSEFDLASLSRISVEQIFLWRTGKDLFIKPRELIRLARAFSPKGRAFVETHAQLLHAQLKDQCIGPGSKLICLEVTPCPDWLITTSFGKVYLTPGVQRDLQVVHNHVQRNPKIRAMVRAIARYCQQEGLN